LHNPSVPANKAVVVASSQYKTVCLARSVPDAWSSQIGLDGFANADRLATTVQDIAKTNCRVFEKDTRHGNAARVTWRERIRGAGAERIIVNGTIALQLAGVIAGTQKIRDRLFQGDSALKAILGYDFNHHGVIREQCITNT
jgi:hypothetical protein